MATESGLPMKVLTMDSLNDIRGLYYIVHCLLLTTLEP
jgi:hypothetical protein